MYYHTLSMGQGPGCGLAVSDSSGLPKVATKVGQELQSFQYSTGGRSFPKDIQVDVASSLCVAVLNSSVLQGLEASPLGVQYGSLVSTERTSEIQEMMREGKWEESHRVLVS